MAEAGKAALEELCNALYASCATHSVDKLFSQDDLLSLNVIPDGDLPQLIDCLNALTNQGLFKLMNQDGRVLWKVVKREDAAKYQSLGVEEAVVYSYIESAGREGVWTRTIRNRSNLHQTVFNRCLKSLESKNLVKPIQSAKFPGRKIYILGHLQPSEDVTGGPFYTDGTLDEEFVHQLGLWADQYVWKRSWCHHSAKAGGGKRSRQKISVEEAEAKRRGVLGDGSTGRSKLPLPMPPGFSGYPKIPEITKAINDSGLSSVIMKEADVSQLMDLLCWDGRVTRVIGGQAFKSVRPTGRNEDGVYTSSLAELPCGRCPVFDLCEEGGPVNARNCVYFREWLET